MLITTHIFLLATIGFLVVYLFMLSVLATCARVPRQFGTTLTRRFAVLIPAHNEEFTIAPTIKSLLELEYPPQDFDVVVVADNCTDRTADVARESGIIVYERTSAELRGKGHALRWCFDRLLSQSHEYDAFVVVDADSIVSANFLVVMNHYLDRGHKVIQSSDLVKPQPDAWSSEMTRLGFTLYNYARPLGRHVIGCSTGLRGNGMCFAADVLRSHPWEAYTRTEDLEFGLSLLLAGIPVAFAPQAFVLATMPQNPQLAESQRARWEHGRFPVIKRYGPLLLRNTLRHCSFQFLDSFIDLITPPLINLMGMVLAILLLTLALFFLGVASMLTFAYIWTLVLLLGFLHMIIGLYASRADRFLYNALFHLPRYIAWKAMLYLKLVRQGETNEWIRTEREPIAEREKSTGV
jgi:1,2-diacylglycerol 3-beta-glucosyltransferase